MKLFDTIKNLLIDIDGLLNWLGSNSYPFFQCFWNILHVNWVGASKAFPVLEKMFWILYSLHYLKLFLYFSVCSLFVTLPSDLFLC